MSSNQITQHFAKYFYMLKADTEELRRTVYNVRYQVYVKEFSYEREEDCPDHMEHDDYDDQSQHCLLMHRPSGMAAGCVRLVMPLENRSAASLPFERFCNEAINPDIIDVQKLEAGAYGEFSRLAVISYFRRRKSDEKKPVSLPEPDANDRDSFPFIPVSLFLAALCMLLNSQLNYGFAMMEPKLARLLKRFGIIFNQVGDIVDYHGMRGPFVINRSEIIPNIKPEVYELMKLVDQQLCRDAYNT